MAIELPETIPVQLLNIDAATQRQVSIGMLRTDMVHPEVSGNKWFKLRENLRIAREGKYNMLLTFGGAYSNHLSATAAAAKLAGLKAIGVVRGEEFCDSLNATLQFCKEQGMHLYFVSREQYKQKEQLELLNFLQEKFDNPFIIPEGGNNEAGAAGAGLIANYIPDDTTHILLSVGSGTTLKGMLGHLPYTTKVIGFAPMKGGKYLVNQIRTNHNNWEITDEFHFGGFGKFSDVLLDFMNDFYDCHHIPLDVVYTSKMMYGVGQLLERGYFPSGCKIVCVHTGGLQGNHSVRGKLRY